MPDEICSYCHQYYPAPVSIHHTTEECDNNRGVGYGDISLEKQALVSELAAIDAQATADAQRQDVVCPFCEEEDFDLIGLKGHLLNGHCADFERTARLPAHFQDGPRLDGDSK
jgi:hypothetical protein